MKPLVFIVGATGSGKTDLALKLATQDEACIINSDSIQVYKDLKIGSAKPNFTKYPNIKHYLFDKISAPEVWTAADFRKWSLEILKRELPVKKNYIVGGSGFYIQALEKGMYKAQPNNPLLQEKWIKQEKEEGLISLYKLLQIKDPEGAKPISPKDRYRIFRSLSLITSEGKTLSQIKKEFNEQKLPWPYTKIGLSISKEELLKRVKMRTQNMLKEGLIEEIEILVKKGLKGWRPLQSVGYKEGLFYLEGKIKKEDLLDKIVNSTMGLAKKQKTWFKKDKTIQWIPFDKDPLEVYKEIFR